MAFPETEFLPLPDDGPPVRAGTIPLAPEALNVLERLGAIRGADLRPQPVPPLKEGFLAEGKLTTLVGTGGIGKGVLSTHIASSLSHDGIVIIWDAENNEGEWTRRMNWMGANPDNWFYLNPGGITQGLSLESAIERLEELAVLVPVKLLVIDSAVMASPRGTDHNSPNAPRYFLEAQARMGITTLLITHNNKENTAEAFGSTYYHALSRVVWYASLAKGAKAINDGGLLLRLVKGNEYPDVDDVLVTARGTTEGAGSLSVEVQPYVRPKGSGSKAILRADDITLIGEMTGWACGEANALRLNDIAEKTSLTATATKEAIRQRLKALSATPSSRVHMKRVGKDNVWWVDATTDSR